MSVLRLPALRRAVCCCGLLLTAVGSSWAQAPAAAPAASATPPSFPALPPIPYTRVAEALDKLKAMDGNGTVVTESEGWVTINEPLATAQWSFAPPGHEAYPAVVRRIIQRGPEQAVNVDTALLCEAKAEACGRLRQQFEQMNERIVQGVKARGRGGSSRPPVAPQ